MADHHFIAFQEMPGHFDAFIQQPARILAQIENQAL